MNCQRIIIATVSLLIAGFVSATSAESSDRVALLIGNGDYPEKGRFADLDNPVNDVFIVANSLKKAGFKVILVQDADQNTMRMKVREFEQQIKPGGTALFYFAGHGVQYEGENYLIGTNARFEEKYELGEEAVKATTVLSAISVNKPKTALMFLDCCRESPPKSWLESNTRGMKTRGLGEMQHPDVVISFAAAPNEPAMDGNGANSPFAEALAREVVKEQELGRVLKAVAKDVYETTQQQQRPWWNGSLMHDFYFVEEGKTPEVDVELPSFASDSKTIGSSDDADWTLLGDGKISASNFSSKTSTIGNSHSADEQEVEEKKPAEPMVLPSRGYFSNAEVFQDGPYESFNDYSKRKVLKAAQGKLSGAGSADGQMGRNTQSAIIAYQGQNSIHVSGRLDSETIKALGLEGMTEEDYSSSNGQYYSGSTRGSSSGSSTQRSNNNSGGGGNGQGVMNAIRFGAEIYRRVR